jgi:aspartyl-tRNA(Asn)/glutamyl-tRNA(Gln) amidotransferase subunit A
MTRREALTVLLSLPLTSKGTLAQSSLSSAALAKEDDLTSLTIAEAGRRLAAKSITPLQLTNAYLARISALNKNLNAYVTVTPDLARREARALEAAKRNSPMWGIPIAHKDLLETRGVRTTAGSLLFDQHVPDENAAIVQQLEDAGAVMLGKTNTHELGGGVTTNNPFYGTTRNPVDETRIPGGSSGGSATAVVARLCAAATGTDTGGSVRIPAALCGCVGYKPTFGKFSTRGLLGGSPTFDHVGFLTRTVEDLQLMTGMAAANGGASGFSRTVRIAVAKNYFFDDLDPAVAGAINVKYPEIDFPIDAKTMGRVFEPVFAFELWGRFGPDWRTNPGSFSKEFSAFFSFPRPSIAEYEEGLEALKEYQAAVDKLFDSVDVVVTPTSPVVAPPIAGRIDGMKILRNTWPLNAAGTPAISIPLKTTGLPVGLQLIAKRGDDDKLLQAARAF